MELNFRTDAAYQKMYFNCRPDNFIHGLSIHELYFFAPPGPGRVVLRLKGSIAHCIYFCMKRPK